MRAPLRDPNKYCDFHKDTGHWTKYYRGPKRKNKEEDPRREFFPHDYPSRREENRPDYPL